MARYADNAFAMSDEEFKKCYRFSKELFEILHNDLVPLLPRTTRRSDISTRYKVLVALSFYATGSYQRLVGTTHGTLMSQQSVSRAIKEVTNALNTDVIVNKWLKFPQTRRERDHIKQRFYEKFQIPSIVGAIDGTHVAIIRPAQNEERFYNRKGFHSRNVLIICDADMNILSVDSSFGGATHDSFILNQHPVKSYLINLLNSGELVYLLGDSGYPQRNFLMTPILDAPANSPEEHYTNMHCVARNIVERTIGVLKNRWRCLLGHRVLHYHPNTAARIINACCVLHNICNKASLSQNDSEDTIPSSVEEDSTQEISRQDLPDLTRGNEARSRLVRELWAARRH
ncbi:putative nuclease HARBI1 [Melitaea cinxia]|uniref:putative nuclease HARBI1 n=1 Tax=Melitaea cinxia TaxID=113334 RepID=UPI001E273142|nr:putative nuclease HARBI1 [Melitaea cinxia]